MSKTKNILISGGSGGIGRAIARRVIEDGYHVINLDQVPPKTLLAGETFHQVDLTNAQATQQLIENLLKTTSILRLVNNAGIIRPGALEDVSLDDFDAVMNLNLRAPMLLAQSLIPAMRSAKFGRIINIASRAALGKEERTAYAASKAGLLGMTRTWALEMASFGITVNAIGPGQSPPNYLPLEIIPIILRRKKLLLISRYSAWASQKMLRTPLLYLWMTALALLRVKCFMFVVELPLV